MVILLIKLIRNYNFYEDINMFPAGCYAYYHYKINNDLVNKYYGKDIKEKNFIKYVKKKCSCNGNFNKDNNR